MNLLILVFIVLVQLVFQSLFFEKYYILKKEKQIKNEIQGYLIDILICMMEYL